MSSFFFLIFCIFFLGLFFETDGILHVLIKEKSYCWFRFRKGLESAFRFYQWRL